MRMALLLKHQLIITVLKLYMNHWVMKKVMGLNIIGWLCKIKKFND